LNVNNSVNDNARAVVRSDDSQHFTGLSRANYTTPGHATAVF